jgi:dethiobiotin synthetase
MPVPGFFITGTDTEVGKTRAAVSVTRALVHEGLRVAAMKPVAAGAVPTADGFRNGDAVSLAAAANVAASYELVNPYCLAAPVSPHIAAADAGISIDIARIVQCFQQLAIGADCVVVEGAGGWLAPIGDRETMADVARALDLPVILVVGLRLGCLSHALLSAQAIEAAGLCLAGWIANHIDPGLERVRENVATLERLLVRPPLAVVPHAVSAAPVEAAAVPRAASAPPGEQPLERGIELSGATIAALRELLRRVSDSGG